LRTNIVIVIATLIFVESAAFVILLVDQTSRTTGIAAAAVSLWKEHPWAHQAVHFGVFDPITTQRYVPNSTTGVLGVNENGFIHNGSSDPVLNAFPQKLEGTVRIILLGGSSMAGNALRSDNTQTIAAYLERELNSSETGSNVYQVLNYGISGGWSFSELRRFFSEIIHFEPDIVINFDGWNDGIRVKFEADRNHVDQALLNWDNMSYIYFEHFNGIGRGKRSAPPLFTFTYLLLEKIGIFSLQNEEAKANLYASHHLTLQSRFLANKYNGLHFALTRNLEAISAYSVANGFRHIAYLQPYADRKRLSVAEEQETLDIFHNLTVAQNGALWQRDIYKKLMGEVYDRFETAFIAYAEKYANQELIEVYDVTDLFADTDEVVYLDSVHYNERGNELIAHRIATDVRLILEKD